MSTFQELILNASDVCSNCFGKQRRKTSKIVSAKNADTDDEGYPIQDDEGNFVSVYDERLQWMTTVEDVPGPTVREAGTLFCDCGAPGAFTRIWDRSDFHLERFAGMLELLMLTLEQKGHTVDEVPYCEAAWDAFHALPEQGEFGPFRADRPTSANDVFAAAVDAGVTDCPADAEPFPTPA